jgi:hypothetical protein
MTVRRVTPWMMLGFVVGSGSTTDAQPGIEATGQRKGPPRIVDSVQARFTATGAGHVQRPVSLEIFGGRTGAWTLRARVAKPQPGDFSPVVLFHYALQNPAATPVDPQTELKRR